MKEILRGLGCKYIYIHVYTRIYIYTYIYIIYIYIQKEPYTVNSGISYLSTDAGVLPSESHHQDGHLRHRRSTGHHFLHLSSRSSPTVQSFGVFCFIFDEHDNSWNVNDTILWCTKHVPWRTMALFQRWIPHVSMCRQVASQPTTMKTTSISWKANFNLRPWTRGFGSLDRLCVFRFFCVEIDATGHQNPQPNDRMI